jgi:hypothetical protein
MSDGMVDAVDILNESAGPPGIRAFRCDILGFVPCILLGADHSRGKALLELVRAR